MSIALTYFSVHIKMENKTQRGFLFLLFTFGITSLHGGESTEKYKVEPKDIPIIVLSQANIYHVHRAAVFRKHITEQIENDGMQGVKVYFLHEDWYHIGSWTILSIIPQFVKQFPDKSALIFCEEETRIDLVKLYNGLAKYDLSKEMLLGRGLRDKEATIIHHFAFHESPSSFAYPDFTAGFVISMPLIKSLSARMSEMPRHSDFSIDAKHELAMYIWNKGEGTRMTESGLFCLTKAPDCATHIPVIFPNCGKPVNEDKVLFAVKTCEKFHEERVPVVKDTWAKDAKHIEFYSDKEDITIPTVDLGVPNTERGHCGKTMAIIKRFRENKEFTRMNWLVITDDDTLMRVPRLYRLLACYDEEEPIALGERYGYGLSDESGYNYITGGGGMVFSRQTVKMIIDLGMCQCGSDDAPDDMILGMCLKRLGIIITHSPYFHQARPMDYSRKYLDHQVPVSFHKHWMIDPRKVYMEWLSESTHDEL